MSDLESTYRRLLFFYPRAYREEYEDEMLGVLLAGARRGQRRPGLRDAIDVLISAAAVHYRHGVASAGAEKWRRTAWVVQTFGAILMLAVAVRRVGMDQIPQLIFGGVTTPYAGIVEPWIRPAGWGLVVLGGLLGWRSVSVVAGTAALAAEIAAPAQQYVDTPARLLNIYWLLISASIVVVAAVFADRDRPKERGSAQQVRRRQDLGRAGPRSMVFGALAIAASGPAELVPGQRYGSVMIGGHRASNLGVVLLGLGVGLIVIGVWRLPPQVRRRLAVCAVPIVGAMPLVQVGFGGLIEANASTTGPATLFGPSQWAALVLIPVAAFAVAAFLTDRYERGRSVSSPGRAEM